MKQRPVSLALVALSALACSRDRARPAAPPPAHAVAPSAPAPTPAVVRTLRTVSPYPDTAAGLQQMFTELARAAAANDQAQLDRLEEQLRLDDDRFALAFTFEGHRQLHSAVVPPSRARLAEKLGRLRALGPGATVTVLSATGEELADGAPHGFDPRIASVRASLRPTVRFYRAEVRGAAGESVVFEPIAFAGGRWVWLAEPWAVVAPVVTVPGTTPSRTR